MKSVVAVLAPRRLRSLLVGLALGATWTVLGASGCILGPKQDDPDQAPATDDTGVGAADTNVTAQPDGGLGLDGAAADTYDPTSGLDGCKGDGGDAAHDGEVGCDAATDGATDGDAAHDADAMVDAPDGEGGSDVATGE